MCVAQTSSYQDETLAMIRKAQSMGLQVPNIEYDQNELAQHGYWIIDSVTIVGRNRTFSCGVISAREYIAKWLFDKRQEAERVAQGLPAKKRSFVS